TLQQTRTLPMHHDHRYQSPSFNRCQPTRFLHSFPTRRSSDLDGPVAVAADDRPWGVAIRAQRGRDELISYRACSSTRATCQASRPAPSAIWCLQLVPSATTRASFEFLTAGRRLSSAIFIETA